MVPLTPTQLTVADQESEGAAVVATVTTPAPAFVVMRADNGGEPGAVLAVSSLLELGSTDVTLTLDPPLTADATVWITVHIDFNGDGVFDESDPVGIRPNGRPAEQSIVVTLPVPVDDGTGS
ncbi:MAG: hypothetical protein MUP76_01260 [Acidimicrobiia bacterium]|nr:hypothetical protein [Acidimicrobiia bacterium]